MIKIMPNRTEPHASHSVELAPTCHPGEQLKPKVNARINARYLKRLRGEGQIYDAIDEWLAPAFARWIAKEFIEGPKDSKKIRRHKPRVPGFASIAH
jgi:hypothetical protein